MDLPVENLVDFTQRRFPHAQKADGTITTPHAWYIICLIAAQGGGRDHVRATEIFQAETERGALPSNVLSDIETCVARVVKDEVQATGARPHAEKWAEEAQKAPLLPRNNWKETVNKACWWSGTLRRFEKARVGSYASLERILANHVAHVPRAIHAWASYLRGKGEEDLESAQNLFDQMRELDDRPPCPEDDSGKRKVPFAWVNPQLRLSYDRTKFVGLSNPGTKGEWVLAKDFASPEGPRGQNALWICFDQNHRIIDRVVRKNVDMDEDWFDIRSWAPGPGSDSRDPITGIPWELACHGAMDSVPGIENLVRMRETNLEQLINRRTRSYRIYTEWAPYGDLDDIIVAYRENKLFIPESFIWAVADGISRCIVAMACGHTRHPDGDQVAMGNWGTIVHRDLKPANIFMGPPHPHLWNHYPTAKVGDFGLSIRTWPNDAMNPWMYRHAGTRGFLAPEQINYLDYDTLDNIIDHKMDLSPLTNVWGMGVILFCMVTRQSCSPTAYWLGNPRDERTYTLSSSERPNVENYSQSLLNFIDACTTGDPSDRLNPYTLPAFFDENREGMSKPRHGQYDSFLLGKHDTYALGLVRHNLLDGGP